MNFSSDKQDWTLEAFVKAHSHMKKEVAEELWRKHFGAVKGEEKPVKADKKKAGDAGGL